MPKYRRTKKIIAPRFQLRVAAAAVTISLVSVMTLMVVYRASMMNMIEQGWLNPYAAIPGMSGMLLGLAGKALLLLIPLTLGFSILISHRVAGPMYRFRVFLADVADGKQVDPCRIRKGDQYKDFCDLLNRVTEPLRSANEEGRDEEQSVSREIDDAA